jgi:hypothetical protein
MYMNIFSQENAQPHHQHEPHSTYRLCPIEPKCLVDETWPSNKRYNARVTASTESTDDHSTPQLNKQQTSRTCTYQVSNGQIIHERIYPAVNKGKLHLSVAVNGASKSMRGQLPLANLNLTNGDFGDDAGMILENSDYCFVGEYSTCSTHGTY